MRYIVKRLHKIGAVTYQAGQVLEIDDPEYAAWLNRDMQGFLEEVVNRPPDPEPIPEPMPEPEPRIIENPPDRMVRTRKKRSRS